MARRLHQRPARSAGPHVPVRGRTDDEVLGDLERAGLAGSEALRRLRELRCLVDRRLRGRPPGADPATSRLSLRVSALLEQRTGLTEAIRRMVTARVCRVFVQPGDHAPRWGDWAEWYVSVGHGWLLAHSRIAGVDHVREWVERGDARVLKYPGEVARWAETSQHPVARQIRGIGLDQWLALRRLSG